MALAEPAGVYRPRHPERTVVYRLFEEHFERYLREYDERYEAREGSLRKVHVTTTDAIAGSARRSRTAAAPKAERAPRISRR